MVVFAFGNAQEDGLGGWTWGPAQKVKVWAMVKPVKVALEGKQAATFIKRQGRAIQARGQRYEVVVRAQGVSAYLSQSILSIVWGKHRLLAMGELQYLDEGQQYMTIQTVLPVGSGPKGEA